MTTEVKTEHKKISDAVVRRLPQYIDSYAN